MRGPELLGEPNFPVWDGTPSSLLNWISQTTQLKEIRNMSDEHAIQYARLKLEQRLQKVYPLMNSPKTWTKVT